MITKANTRPSPSASLHKRIHLNPIIKISRQTQVTTKGKIIKKIIVLPWTACNAEQDTTPLTVLSQAVSSADAVELPKQDNDNTKYYQVPATDELLAIYNGQFWAVSITQ